MLPLPPTAAARVVLLPALLHARLPCARMSTSPLIEVEKKFAAPSDHAALEAAVVAEGGTHLGTKSFTDVYYDTAGCSLTRRDMWLRCRDGAWELKLPVEEDARRSGGERTVFTEVEGEEAVAKALQSLLPVAEAPQTPLAELLASAQVSPFAEFSTSRSKWTMGSASIDADVASFGHAVMEIEVMCSSQAEVAAAEAEIARVADLLGAQPLSKGSGGKLETYIRRHCPSVLEQLVEAGVLRASES